MNTCQIHSPAIHDFRVISHCLPCIKAKFTFLAALTLLLKESKESISLKETLSLGLSLSLFLSFSLCKSLFLRGEPSSHRQRQTERTKSKLVTTNDSKSGKSTKICVNKCEANERKIPWPIIQLESGLEGNKLF